MKKRNILFFSLAIFIFHSTLLQFLRIDGIIPNLSLIFIIVFSTIYSNNEGVLLALFLGFFQDLFLMKAFGINIIIYILIAYVVSGLEESLFKDNFITPIAFIFASTFSYYVLEFVFMYFLGDSILFSKFIEVCLKEAIYNCCLGLLIYSIFLKKVHGFSLR